MKKPRQEKLGAPLVHVGFYQRRKLAKGKVKVFCGLIDDGK